MSYTSTYLQSTMCKVDRKENKQSKQNNILFIYIELNKQTRKKKIKNNNENNTTTCISCNHNNML